jgi:hypothetical protein
MALPLAVFSAANESAHPFLTMLPREASLDCIGAQLAAHFGIERFSLLHGDVELSWKLPLGVQHEALASAEGDASTSRRLLPFVVVARASDEQPPAADAARTRFFSRLKEAAFLATGSATGAMTLPTELASSLWLAARTGKDVARCQSALSEALLRSRRASTPPRTPVRLYHLPFSAIRCGPLQFVTSSHAAPPESTVQSFVAAVAAGSLVPGQARVYCAGIVSPPLMRVALLHARLRSCDHYLHLVIVQAHEPIPLSVSAASDYDRCDEDDDEAGE